MSFTCSELRLMYSYTLNQLNIMEDDDYPEVGLIIAHNLASKILGELINAESTEETDL